MAAKANSIDMIHGGLWGKILKFSLIYMLTAFLQHLYSAADIIVVGRFAGEQALAGVGASTGVANLFVNFFMGFGAGATIVLGQAIGARDSDKISRAAHTSIALAVYGGLVISVLCFVFTKPILMMMDTPENVMGEAMNYLRIRAIGFMPAVVYNFGSAMLRAKGDTKRALYIVTASGIINVGLNLYFVTALHMGAGGVALATIISQVFTAVAVLLILCRENDAMQIHLRKVRLHKKPLLNIVKFGFPSAIQSSFYTVSNMIVQSTINGFGSAAVAGTAASSSIGEFYNTMANSLYQGSVVFCSQNYGAKKFDRINKTIGICLAYALMVGVIQAIITYFAGEFLLGFYIDVNKEPELMYWGMKRLNTLGYTYFLLGCMNIMTGGLRGMGASLLNMIVAIIGVCGIRIAWIYFGFPQFGTLESLFWCFPLSWLGTFLMHSIMFAYVFRKEKKKTLLQV